MDTHFASGHWHARAGQADAFAERWSELISWTRDNHPGLRSATLMRGEGDPDRFVSFAVWESATTRAAWKASEGFGKRLMACRELCDEFVGGDYDAVVTF